jgi:hypothetical protein
MARTISQYIRDHVRGGRNVPEPMIAGLSRIAEELTVELEEEFTEEQKRELDEDFEAFSIESLLRNMGGRTQISIQDSLSIMEERRRSVQESRSIEDEFSKRLIKDSK